MVKMSKKFNSLNDAVNEISEQFDCLDSLEDVDYETVVSAVFDRTILTKIPSIFNASYPNCNSITINKYGFTCMTGNIGFGISPFSDRVTKNIVYTVSFAFDLPDAILELNPVFKYASASGYERKDFIRNNKKNNK